MGDDENTKVHPPIKATAALCVRGDLVPGEVYALRLLPAVIWSLSPRLPVIARVIARSVEIRVFCYSPYTKLGGCYTPYTKQMLHSVYQATLC